MPLRRLSRKATHTNHNWPRTVAQSPAVHDILLRTLHNAQKGGYAIMTQRAQNYGIWLKLYRASYYGFSHIPLL